MPCAQIQGAAWNPQGLLKGFGKLLAVISVVLFFLSKLSWFLESVFQQRGGDGNQPCFQLQLREAGGACFCRWCWGPELCQGQHNAEPLLPLNKAAPALVLIAGWVEGVILCGIWSPLLRITVTPPLPSLLPLWMVGGFSLENEPTIKGLGVPGCQGSHACSVSLMRCVGPRSLKKKTAANNCSCVF